MNRQEFMNRLTGELSKLPEDEIQAAIEYYNEYFDEAGPQQEQIVIKDLGSPSRIAAQIKADYAVRQFDEPAGSQKRKPGLSAVLWVIMGIFAAPIAFPTAIALGAVAFAVFITIFAVIVSLIVSLVAFCIGGISLIVVGVAGITGSFAAGLMLIGMGLVSAGASALLCAGVGIGARALTRILVKEFRKYCRRRQEKKAMKEGKYHG